VTVNFFVCLFVSLFLYCWMVVKQAFSIRICLVCNVKIDLSLFNVESLSNHSFKARNAIN
jgi:hypothetical protein